MHHRCVRFRLSLLVCVAVLLAAATAFAGSARSGQTRALRIVATPTPHFPLRHYVTSGHYPNVRGTPGLAITNAALRGAILADQRKYARRARWYANHAGAFQGHYQTSIDRALTSASTVVVSTLIPAGKYFPGGNDGEMWISATVDVRTGKTLSLGQLLANPRLALPALARDWRASLLRQHSSWRQMVTEYRPSYPATLMHYRHFALTPTGLAVGFPQEPAGSRLAALIPYRFVDAYLSRLGKRLVAGVRRPLTNR